MLCVCVCIVLGAWKSSLMAKGSPGKIRVPIQSNPIKSAAQMSNFVRVLSLCAQEVCTRQLMALREQVMLWWYLMKPTFSMQS